MLHGVRALLEHLETLPENRRRKLCVLVVQGVTLTLYQLHKKGRCFGKSLEENLIVSIPIPGKPSKPVSENLNDLSSEEEEESLYEVVE